MRLHTDHITEDHIRDAARDIAPGVGIQVLTSHKSRTRERAFEVRLFGNASHTYGHDYPSATYDEWGAFIARLYRVDADTVWGPSEKNAVYRDVYYFEERTMYRFEGGEMPEDAHRRHRWAPTGMGYFRCRRCSAEMWNGWGG